MARVTSELLEWASASRPQEPGEESGDACLVHGQGSHALVAAVDGLGHGPQAAVAARAALALLARAEREHPIEIVRRCHQGLRETRGVVLSLARFDAHQGLMTWIGVGDVQGVLLRSDREAEPRQELLLLRGGILGRKIPPLQAAVLSVSPGDTLVLATDGVEPHFVHDLMVADAPQPAAERILAEHGTRNDDALVVVARYRGGST